MKKKLLILSPVLLICAVLLMAQATEPITKKLSRKYSESGFDLNVDKVIKDFKQTLLAREILTIEDMNNPNTIYAKLSKVEDSINPMDLGIQGFIDKKPLTEFLASTDILSLNTQVQVDMALFTYYQVFSAKYCLFKFHLTDKRLVEFNGEILPINSFESVLFEAFEDRAFRNVTVKNAKIVLKVDSATPNEFVSFVRTKLASMGLRSATFSR